MSTADTASFELRVSPGSRAVTRMLTCCLGKGLEIVELSWRAGEPEARAALTLSGDPARLARAGLWLDRLVEVIEVQSPTRAATTQRSSESPELA
jgi:hypothetical protein